MVAPGRRTLVVLAILVASMTLTSALLLSVEPGPRGMVQPPSLNKVGGERGLAEELFATTPGVEAGRWNTIAIHFSGWSYGSARSLGQVHERMGLGGLGYHFVVGNGLGAGDGQVEIGPCWKQQLSGISGMVKKDGSRRVIDICLVGDGSRRPPTEKQMGELVQLVHELQGRLGISSEQVLLYTDHVTGRGRLFPVAWFRQQLLSYARP